MNEKWFALSLSDIEKKLKTNAASGLSRKAARSRWTAEHGSVFTVPVRSPLSYLGEIVSDFALIMLMIMSFLALCFDESGTGIVSSVVIMMNLAVCLAIYYRSEFLCDSLERYFLPRCRAVREGRLYSVDGSRVVRGDVIMVEAGDILPCDARLVTSEGLRVRMLYEKKKYLLLDKKAEARVSENENDVRHYDNIIHAGSVIVSGSARAIVTEVGRYTYIGAKLGGISKESRSRRNVPRILTLFKKYCTTLGIVLLITVLPFSILCMLFGNTTLSLFTAFITAMAIAASSMSALAATVCKVFFTRQMRSCLSADAPAIVRSGYAMDRLAAARYLFILDGAALCDGALHFESFYTGEGEFSFEDGALSDRAKEAAKKLGELCVLYDGAQRTSLATSIHSFGRYDTGISEFIGASGIDGGALKIRCAITGFVAATGSANDASDKLFYTDMGDKYVLNVSYTDSIISACAEIITSHGRSAMDSAAKNALMNRYRSHKSAGKNVLVFTLCRHDGYASLGERCFVGMLVLSSLADKNAPRALACLESEGLRPVFFKNITVDGEVPSVSVIPSGIASGNTVRRVDLERIGKPVTYGFGSFSCYDSFSDVQVCELMDAIRKNGQSVCVLGFCERFERIYSRADAVITCSLDEYTVKGGFESEIDRLQEHDDPSREQVSEVLRTRADVTVPRPARKKAGGCTSLVIALRSARRACANTAAFFRYVVCMQIVRMVLVMVPMLFGSTALDARHVLLGGMIADLFVMLSFLNDKERKTSYATYRATLRELEDPIRTNLTPILLFGVSALFAAVLPELISFIPNVPRYIDKTEYSLISFVLFHIAVFVCMRFEIRASNIEKAKKLFSKRPDTVNVLYPAVMCALLVLCFLVEPMSVLFDIEGFSSAVYLLASFAPPIISIALYFFMADMKIDLKRHVPDTKDQKGGPSSNK